MSALRRGDGSNDPQVSELIIDGRPPLPVFVKKNGTFYCLAPATFQPHGKKAGPNLEAPSLPSLRKKAIRAYRAAGRVAIAITIADYQNYIDSDDPKNDPPEFTDYTLVGTRGRADLVLIDSDGDERTMSTYQGTWVRRLDEVERQEITELYEKWITAERAFRDYMATRTINPWELLEEAAKAAEAEGPAEPAEA